MNTKQYTKQARREVKRLQRHPAYKALQARTALVTTQRDKLQADLAGAKGRITQLEDVGTDLAGQVKSFEQVVAEMEAVNKMKGGTEEADPVECEVIIAG